MLKPIKSKWPWYVLPQIFPIVQITLIIVFYIWDKSLLASGQGDDALIVFVIWIWLLRFILLALVLFDIFALRHAFRRQDKPTQRVIITGLVLIAAACAADFYAFFLSVPPSS